MGAHNSSHQHHEQNENLRYQKRIRQNASGAAYRDYKEKNSKPRTFSREYQHDSFDKARQSR